jgi:enediyne biosynthesis protein E4
MMKNVWVVGIGTALLLSSCQSEPTLFERLDASQTGIAFENRLTETENANILAYEYFYNGGGVAVGDFNNDGLPDVYFTGNQMPNKLYINKGNLSFEDITEKAGVAARTDGWKTGVTLADVNADGWLDIYVCYSGNFPAEKRKNQLFINSGAANKGQISFSEQAEAYGIADVGYSTQGLFFDYDTDGDLDLFVLNHNLRGYQRKEAAYLKKEFDPDAGDRLYKNDSPHGHFTDVTREAGIISNALGFGLGIATGDFNGDNKPDLYVCNDYVEEDYAYLNNGDGTFSERGKEMMGHFSYSTMGVDIADVNNDAFPDIFTTDMLPEDNRRQKLLSWPDNWNVQQAMLENGFHWQNMRNMLHINSPRGVPSLPPKGGIIVPPLGGRGLEVGQLAGVQATDWSWAGLLADFDNDGLKDLFVSNGFVRDYTDLDFVKYYADEQMNGEGKKSTKSLLEHLKKMPSTPTHHYIFKNETLLSERGGAGIQFSNQVKAWGFEHNTIASGAAYADFDQDGDLELITCNTNEPAVLYRNQQQEQNPQNYLKIKLKGQNANPFGVGAKVYVYAQKQVQYQEFTPTRGFQACMYDNLHFGLGKTVKIDSLRVLWPSNKSQLLTQIELNKVQLLEEKNAVAFDPTSLLPRINAVFEEVQGLDFTHHENREIDFNTQILLPYLYSYGGPRMSKGDVNGDRLEDIYVGGATNQAGQLFLQTPKGDFRPHPQAVFEADKAFEDRDAVLFDADGDRDLDLYVVSGEYNVDYAQLQDRLYLNDGKGKFNRSLMGQIPEIMLNKTCVEAFDADKDGDLDLFLGGGVQTGNFPYNNESHLLRNDGKGHFELAQKWDLGLVTDVAVADLNQDKTPELIVTAEWKPMQIIDLKTLNSKPQTLNAFSGLWNRITPADLDGDGDTDFVVGNIGLNTPLKGTTEQPITLYYDDFDQNGRFDPFISFYNQGKAYPLAGRDEALEQLVALRKIFTDYKSYSNATAEEVLGKDWSARAAKLTVNETRTGILWNEKGKLTFKALPLSAQTSPIYAISVGDFDGDAKTDILLAGNQSKFRIRVGKTDANCGLLLRGNGKGDFEAVASSGLQLTGDIRDVQRVNNRLIFSANDGKVQTYQSQKR